MRSGQLSGLETTVHKTNEWLHDITRALGGGDDALAYAALRAVLHALRDRLTVNEAAQLGAQLPMLIRGLYYEGWRPSGKPIRTHKAEFLASVCEQCGGQDQMHPEVLTRAVLNVLAHHVCAGEIRDVMAILPSELQDLWPRAEGRMSA